MTRRPDVRPNKVFIQSFKSLLHDTQCYINSPKVNVRIISINDWTGITFRTYITCTSNKSRGL